MRSEGAEWKDALFSYINEMNEIGMQSERWLSKSSGLTSASHRQRLLRKLRVCARRDAELGMRQVRSEMRVRIERHRTGLSEAQADIAIHHVRSWEQAGQPWIEERIEREAVRFIRAAQGWHLTEARPLADERLASAQPEIDEVQQDELNEPFPSVPLVYTHGYTHDHPGARKSKVFAGPGIARESNWNARRDALYRREDAVAYAERWWKEPNNAYLYFDVNCTNYVSQCVFAGGAPMNYTDRRESGWWYKGRTKDQELWSYSWAVAHALQTLLSQSRAYGLRAEAIGQPEDLQLGDVICYDWDGSGRYGHNTIVTAFTPDGMPLVNANTVSSRHRYWDYRDSYAWTEQTRYRFYHISDDF